VKSRVRAAVIDDEPLAREHLIALLASEPDIEVVGEAGGASTAVQLIGATKPDVVFLDIEMPGGSGFEVLTTVAPTHLPLVVFVTAYDAHAIRAFEVAAVDYLLKPVAERRFRAAVRRAVDRVRSDAGEMGARLATLLEQLPRDANDRIPVKSASGVAFVNVGDIDWIDAADDEVRLHVGDQTHALRETMAKVETRLPSRFVRIHRSVIVNTDRVREIQPWFKGDYVLILADGTRLTSGRTYQERVRQLLR
jgi:two-component system, LytTR family, response regulator